MNLTDGSLVRRPALIPGLAVLAMFCVVNAGALPKDTTFRADGPDYIAEATGKGESESSAQNDALRLAIEAMMQSLGRDALFTELFLKNPPVTMSWKKLSSEKGVSSWTVRLQLTVDDESIRLLYNTMYVSTVTTLLDDAEKRLADAETLFRSARTAETDGDLGRAMSLYWQARDACDAGLDLVSPIGDAAVFSTQGKKKAPELREVLTTVRSTVVAGYDRIRKAEQGLAADEALSSVIASIDQTDKAISEIEVWSAGIGARAAAIESTPKASLQAFSDELGSRYRTLSDARLAIGRMEQTVPKSKEIVLARMDVLRRRIDSQSSYLKSVKADVDREIRDPAMARAKRAQALRWALLHEPTGALSLRLFTPFGLDPEADEITFLDTGLFEFGLAMEGVFGRSLWAATRFSKDDALLSSTTAGVRHKNTGYGQSIDVGVQGRSLLAAGFGWDWLRDVDGTAVDKRSAIRLSIGGLDEARHRAVWLATLSWELPYEMGGFEAVNIFNLGLDTVLRLGSAAELRGEVSLRPRQSSVWQSWDSSLAWSVSAGVRLPKPFMWGIEYAGQAASALDGVSTEEAVTGSFVRMYLEYSL